MSGRYGKHSLARTTLVSNIFPWLQRRSSHSISPVSDFTFLRLEFSNNFNASIIYMPGKLMHQTNLYICLKVCKCSHCLRIFIDLYIILGFQYLAFELCLSCLFFKVGNIVGTSLVTA